MRSVITLFVLLSLVGTLSVLAGCITDNGNPPLPQQPKQEHPP